MLRTVGDLAPGDELDVLVAEELAEFATGEEIEVALAPCGTPGVAFAGSGAHFRVVVGKVDDEFGYTGLHVANGVFVEVRPPFRRDAGVDGDGVIDDYVIGAEGFLEIEKVGKPVAGDEERQLVFMRQAERDCEEILVGAIQTILMGIEMGGANAHGVSTVDLRAQLDFGFDGIDVRFRSPVVMEIAILVEQAGDFAGGSNWTPAVVNAFTGQSQMKSEIDFGMRFGVVGNFREPGAGNHNTGGIDCARFEGFDGGGVDGVRDAKIVGMDDQELCVGWVAELLGESISLRNLRVAGTCYSGEDNAAK